MSRNTDDDAGPDQGGFLGRWSKRKALARTHPDSERADRDEAPAPVGAPDSSAATAGQGGAEEADVFDITKLPSLDEITAQTNLSDFLRKEVPVALRNAALKKAWALDPVIRDYVNPAMEYAYDWNTPGGVPGNGPIETAVETLREMVATAQSAPLSHTLDERDSTGEQALRPERGPPTTASEPSPVRLTDLPQAEKSPFSTVTSAEEGTAAPSAPSVDVRQAGGARRRHGGAMPV